MLKTGMYVLVIWMWGEGMDSNGSTAAVVHNNLTECAADRDTLINTPQNVLNGMKIKDVTAYCVPIIGAPSK